MRSGVPLVFTVCRIRPLASARLLHISADRAISRSTSTSSGRTSSVRASIFDRSTMSLMIASSDCDDSAISCR